MKVEFVYYELWLGICNYITVKRNDHQTEIILGNHMIIVLDWNTCNHILVWKLWVFDRNIWYQITVQGTLK